MAGNSISLGQNLMKVLVCGVGRITDELLKRVSEDWEITVVEKDEKKLEFLNDRFPNILRAMHGDASSPVVLEQAGLAKQDYVLALTNDDRVNYAIAAFAKEKNIHNIMAVVRDPEILPKFKGLDVWTTPTATTLARKIYNHLKDPHLNVIDLGQGEGEILELELDDIHRVGPTDTQGSGCQPDPSRPICTHCSQPCRLPHPVWNHVLLIVSRTRVKLGFFKACAAFLGLRSSAKDCTPMDMVESGKESTPSGRFGYPRTGGSHFLGFIVSFRSPFEVGPCRACLGGIHGRGHAFIVISRKDTSRNEAVRHWIRISHSPVLYPCRHGI